MSLPEVILSRQVPIKLGGTGLTNVGAAGTVLTSDGKQAYWGNNAVSNIVDTVGTLAQLGAGFPDGTRFVVTQLADWYALFRASTEVPDGVNVIAAVGGGNWERMNLGAPRWLDQTTWVVDPTNPAASDLNQGNSTAAPLKTGDEIRRRWGTNPTLSRIYNIDQRSALTSLDLGSPRIASAGGISWSGVNGRTKLFSGVMTTVQAGVPGTNTDWQVLSNDIPVSWTASGLVNKLIIVNGGARQGNWAWVAKDLGGKNARISYPLSGSATFPPTTSPQRPALATFQNGDTFDVWDVPSIGLFSLDTYMQTVASGNYNEIYFTNVGIPSTAFPYVSVSGGGALTFWQSDVNNIFAAGGILNLAGCRTATTRIVGDSTSGQAYIYGSLMTGALAAARGGMLTIDGESMMQGSGLTVEDGATCRIGRLSVWDAALAVLVRRGGNVSNRTANFGSHLLWGSGNTVGVQVQQAQYIYQTTKPSIATTGNNAVVGGTAKAWAAIPYIETATPGGLSTLSIEQ